MNAQDVILGSRVAHLRELKAEIDRLKAENARLRAENEELNHHLDLAALAAEDLRGLSPSGRLVLVDGWNLILSTDKQARNPQELVEQMKDHLAGHPDDFVWVVFDGPKESARQEGRLRISYTGGTGPHRADRFITDFVRMSRFRGDLAKIEVWTHDKDFIKSLRRLGLTMAPDRRSVEKAV